MAEPRFQILNNGQEVRVGDIHSMSGNAALADDRVLWELVRTLPYDVAGPQKFVLPYGIDGWRASGSQNSTALVYPSPTGGAVRVRTVRCGVSSLTSGNALERVRGVRTGYSPATNDGYAEVSLAANASADPRWTLVYAKIEPDKNGDTATVVVRDVGTGNVGAVPNVVVNKKCTVTLDTVNGTPAGSPTRPALPADAAGAYYIHLVYLLIPGSFNNATVLDRQAIYEVAPVLTLHSATGASSLRPANQQHQEDGTVDTNQSGASSTFRPGAYLPSTMVGGEERLILIQNHLTPHSHADGDVVDDSTDWRFRYFDWHCFVKAGNTTAAAFASDRQATGTSPCPNAFGVAGTNTATGMGQSYIDDTTAQAGVTVADGNGTAFYISSANVSVLGAGAAILLYVRNTDGALIVKYDGTPNVQLFLKLRATAPYSNFGTV